MPISVCKWGGGEEREIEREREGERTKTGPVKESKRRYRASVFTVYMCIH